MVNGFKYILAVNSIFRIGMGLEEGNSKATDKIGNKV